MSLLARHPQLVEAAISLAILVGSYLAARLVSHLFVFLARDYTEQGLAMTEVHEEVDRRFREAGIEIPLPIRTLIQRTPAPAIDARSQG